MDVICIKQDEFKHYSIGSIYTMVEISCEETDKKWDAIVDKFGIIHPYQPLNFMSINEWRENQINKLLE